MPTRRERNQTIRKRRHVALVCLGAMLLVFVGLVALAGCSLLGPTTECMSNPDSSKCDKE